MEVATHLFLIYHGQATSSLISSTYGFTCGPIFLSFLNCKTMFLLFKVCFCFCFLERMWSCLILWVFCVFFSQENLWVYGLLEIGLVNVFMGLFLGFIYRSISWIFFFFLDLMDIGFGCWNWIWGLLEIGLVASWTWEEHEEYFLLVFNLIFSSFHLCSSNMGLSSW